MRYTDLKNSVFNILKIAVVSLFCPLYFELTVNSNNFSTLIFDNALHWYIDEFGWFYITKSEPHVEEE